MTHGGVTWYSPAYLPVVAAGGAACAAVVVWAYRSQLRGTSRVWRWVVPGFRVAAVAAVMASVLRPSVLRPARPEDAGAVAVVLDDSASMSVADAGSWTPAELVELADGLHELPAGVARWNAKGLSDPVARVRPLIDEAARAAGEAEYARLAGRSVEAAQLRASQARGALLAACNGLAAKAKTLPAGLAAVGQWGDAKAILDTKGKEAWGELRGRVAAAEKAIEAYQAAEDAKLYAADGRVREACDALGRLSRAEIARRVVERVVLPSLPAGAPVRVVAASDPGRVIMGGGATTRPVVPGGEPAAGTVDLAGALRVVTQQPVAGRKGAVRAVVLLSDGRRGASASPVLPGGPPVVACRCTPGVVRDVAVRDVTAPATAYVGDEAAVHVEVGTAGYAAGAKVPVTAAWDGGEARSEVAVDRDGRASADVPVRFARAGVRRVGVRVGPAAGEATDANDSAERYVKVLTGRVGVLGLATADSDDRTALADVLGHLPGIVGTVVPVAATGEPAVAAGQVLGQRVVVLDDVSVEGLTAEQMDAVRQLVSDRGGTLVLVAGRWHWPLDDTSEAMLADLLPYRDMGGPSWRSAAGREAVVAPDADPDGVLAAAAAAAGGPVVDRFLRIGELKAGVRVLMTEPDGGMPVVTEMPVGSGRVLTVTADGTVRQGAESRRFWEGLLRYAAGVPYAAEREGYGLDADRVDVPADGVIHVRVKVPAENGTALPEPSLVVRSGDQVVRTEALVASSAEGGKFEATVRDLPPGDYVAQLHTAPAGDDVSAVMLELPLHVRSGLAEELADVTADEAFLRQVADASGGDVLPVAEAGRLPAELQRHGGGDRPKTVEYALWDSPYLFLFVTACLSAEWALRKRLGLA